MFTTAYRQQVSDRVLAWAESDDRITAAAIVGSLAHGPGDRWSDLDLTFAVMEGVGILQVLEDWTTKLVAELDAVRLFDLPSGSAIYRVFLLPGWLQFDLSFTPASDFGAIGPNFKLLFGAAVEKPHIAAPIASNLLGYAVHHLLRARLCIARNRYGQAEYWLSRARDYTLSLACARRGLPAHYGRGIDDLPVAVRECLGQSLVARLERQELLRALDCVIHLLLQEGTELDDLCPRVRRELGDLAADAL